MLLDAYAEFADAVSVAAAAGTALIGNVMDLQLPHRDIGNGEATWLVITIDTSIIAASAGTVQFLLVSDAQAAIAVDGSATVHYASRAFPTNVIGSTDPKIKAGQVAVCVALPLEGAVYEEFLGILCVTATATTTFGKINAFLTLDPYGWIDYPKAVS